MGFLTRSFTLFKSIWHLLMEDKRMLWFPILSFICLIILFIPYAMALIGIWVETGGEQANYSITPHDSIYFGILSFIFYILVYMIATFFNAALIYYADGKLNDQPMDVKKSLAFAWSRFGLIFVWSVIAATVGLLLNMLSRHEAIARIIEAIIGTVWSLISFLALPVIVIEGKTPFKAISEAVNIFKKVWGENITISTGLGLLLLLFFALGGGIFYISTQISYPSISIGLLLFSILFCFVVGIVFAALNQILATALYLYARSGKVPVGFDEEMLQNTVRKRRI